MKANIPETDRKRIVILGAGFGGLALARQLAKIDLFEIVLIDKNNYHQFQPLFYQVAMAGLEPSAIAFPLRKVFQSNPHVHIRVTEVQAVHREEKFIDTPLGKINYDYLVLSLGADTNFFGNEEIKRLSLPMKSISEALGLRNRILNNFEQALVTEDSNTVEALMNIVVVGGGPTGVEVSGTLAEMKNRILPKDYPSLDFKKMRVVLVESGAELLGPMSENAHKKSKEYLTQLGVEVVLGKRVTEFDGSTVTLNDGTQIRSNNLVWAAGVRANKLPGLESLQTLGNSGRIEVDAFNCSVTDRNIYCIGDMAAMPTTDFPNGHPQLAQPAIQQGKHLANNFKRILKGSAAIPFTYKDLGSMATVGRNLAVVDLPKLKFSGFFAWATWMFVHLMAIVGVKNRLLIFVNWLWNYVTYDQSLRLIIKAKEPEKRN